MPIKDLPINLRPREKALRIGVKNLTDIELLAIFLRSGGKNFDVLDLAKNLIQKYQSFKMFKSFNIYDLIKIRGIGIVKAIEIAALFEFSKRLSDNMDLTHLQTIDEALNYGQSIIPHGPQEHFLIVLLDHKNQIIYHEIMYKGIDNAVEVEPQRIVGLVLSFKAKKFYCFHNHPSGQPYPSFPDRVVTSKIAHYGQLMNIEFISHIILCDDGQYFVFK